MFHSRGWKVTFTDIDSIRGARLVDKLGEGVMFVEADTRNREALTEAVQAGTGRFGPLSAVFANAGIHRSNTLLDISDAELHTMVDINIFGTINTLQAALPGIIETGGGAVVINCSDQWFVGKAHSFGYGLTKGALGQITRSLSIDLGPKKVRVNAICAGTIHTPLVDRIFERCSQAEGRPVEEFWAEENALFAGGRVGTPEEVARMVWFLATPESSFCTGGHFPIDGGLSAR